MRRRANNDPGCNLHGWAFTYGCPGCDAADDRVIAWEIRWPMLRMRWFPYRVVEFRGLDENGDADWGAQSWMPPDRGPFRWLMLRWRGCPPVSPLVRPEPGDTGVVGGLGHGVPGALPAGAERQIETVGQPQWEWDDPGTARFRGFTSNANLPSYQQITWLESQRLGDPEPGLLHQHQQTPVTER